MKDTCSVCYSYSLRPSPMYGPPYRTCNVCGTIQNREGENVLRLSHDIRDKLLKAGGDGYRPPGLVEDLRFCTDCRIEFVSIGCTCPACNQYAPLLVKGEEIKHYV